MKLNNTNNTHLNIEYREYNKVYGCSILVSRYFNVFNSVFDKWAKYVAKSSEKDVSVAEIIQNNYKIPYAAAAYIAQSIALSKSISR